MFWELQYLQSFVKLFDKATDYYDQGLNRGKKLVFHILKPNVQAVENARNLLWLREDGSSFKSPHICRGIVGAPPLPDLWSVQATEVERSVCHGVCVCVWRTVSSELVEFSDCDHLPHLFLRRLTSEQHPCCFFSLRSNSHPRPPTWSLPPPLTT